MGAGNRLRSATTPADAGASGGGDDAEAVEPASADGTGAEITGEAAGSTAKTLSWGKLALSTLATPVRWPPPSPGS